MALHHLPMNEKVALYRRIHNALAAGGIFAYGDYVADADEAAELAAQYAAAIARLGGAAAGPLHLDIPFTVEDELRALRAAGFTRVGVPFRTARAAVFHATS